MTDMYLNDLDRKRSRTGCFVLIAALLLVAITVALFLLRRDREPAPETILAEAATQTMAEKPAKPAAPAHDPGPALLAEMRSALEREQYQQVRELGWRILDTSKDPGTRAKAEQILGDVHILLVFSPRPMPEKVDYTIQRGDTLAVLARRHGTTIDLIQKGNRLTGSMIRVGDRLRILQGDFSIEVSKTRNDLVLYLNDRFFKRYRVGTGEYHRTPEGTFQITDRIAQPTWWRPDGKAIPFGSEDNLLGTHWLSIDVPGYGLHGTWEPDTIGYQSSAGCVRLLNEDIEELYHLLPVGVPVVITE